MRAQHSMVIRCLLRPQQRPAQLNMTPRPGTQSASGLRQARSAAAAGRVAWQQPDFARLRAAERGRVSVTKFPLRGVSFEERQSHLKQVAPGDPVMLVREPGNEHDPKAVAVRLLDGHTLGYVPRDFTGAISRWVELGKIESAGPAADTGLLGARVSFHVQLEPLVAEAIPPQAHASCARLAPLDPLGEPAKQQLLQRVLHDARGRCRVSGATGLPLAVAPLWEVDDHAGEVRLAGLQAVAQQLAEAQTALLRPGPLDRLAAAAFCGINDWSEAALDAYRKHQLQLLQQREEQGSWQVLITDKARQELGAA